MKAKPKNNKKNRKLKLVLGPVLAMSFVLTAYATSNSEGTGLWNIPFSGLGNTQVSDIANTTFIGYTNFAINDSYNEELVAASIEESTKAVLANSTQCADPSNPKSLGQVQKKALESRRIEDSANINLDQIFAVGKKGGCFDALLNFPDLSISIPSISGIFDSLKQTLLKYAVRKVCTAVNEVLEEAVDPLKETIQGLSDRGQLDLSGRVNYEVAKQLYEIDPELGRISRPSDAATTIELGW